MKALNEKIYLEKIEGELFREKIVNGKVIKIPNHYRGMDIQSQKAKIKFPNELLDAQVGDVVYCHHFLNDESSKKKVDGQYVYELSIDDIYCKIIDDNIIMFRDWLFVEPIITESIIIGGEKPETHVGIVRHGNFEFIGKKIAFSINSDYKLNVEGKEYYRLKIEDVMGYFTE